MPLLPEHARQRNDFRVIRLTRPRIERAADCTGYYVLRGDHGWLVGDRREALREFAELVGIERAGRHERRRQPGGTRVVADDPSKVEGRAMTVVRFPREYREPPPPEREPQLELWPDLPATPRRATPSSLLAEIKQEFAALYEHVDAICAHADAIHLGFGLLDSLYGDEP